LNRLVLAPQAVLDLQEIHDYISQDNSEAADKWIDKIGNTFEVLCSQPGIGRQRDEIRAGYRSLAKGEYVIFFRKGKNATVEIIRVIHGKRDLRMISFQK
jgi:toxin ParE1/3/4